MDIEPQNFFHILLDHAQDSIKGPAECHRLLTILNYNLTEEQLNTALIDLYILHVFDRSNGLFKFVLETSSNSKFDNACVKALEIIFALINNFYQKVEEYVLDVNSRCLKVLQTKASARIKIKVLEVLIISFEKIDKGLDFQLEYTQVFEGIRACLIQAVHPNSVRQKEFTAVGLFAKKFSYLVSDSHFLKNYFLSELETSMVKGPSQSTIYGVFTGFSYFCESFPLNKDHPEDSAILQKLYGYIYKLAIAQCDQHYGNRAALVYFGTYMSLFENVVVLKYKEWHKILLQKWLAMGVDDKKVGEQTLRSLLFTLAGALSRMDKTQGMPILKHFIQWFKSILRKSEAPDSEKRLCMQGLNYFSRPLYEYYTKEEAREVFLMLMQSFERNFAFGEGAESEQGEFLPDYVQCLAGFMRYQSFSNSEVHCLQRAIINIIKTFDKLKPLHHSIIIECLVSTFFYLRQTNHFDSFIENIVYQGVVWSCSHQHISDADLTEEQEKIVTVKNYFPLWRGLLKMVSNLSYDKIAIYHEDRHHILTKLVNELVKTLMVLVNKLNVNVKLKEDVIQTDLQSAYQVEHPNDFNIFLNITDFYQEVLASIDAEMLRHCSCRIINHLIGKCLRYPLVSGFYKLLSFGLKIADSLKLFDGGSVTLNQDIANCKETLAKFLTSLLHRMKLFKDELLISCLYVLLESPVVVVEPLLPECAGIFITIFDLGRSYIALANIGLSTLEKWQQCMKQDDFEQFLLQVVSSLDSYLRSKSLGGLTQTAAIEKKRKTARMLKKRAVLVELDSELVQFQKRVLRFVGSQNSKVCEAFVSPDNNFERKVTSDNLHLKVTLPYNDIALEVYLEPFIMRVVDLCLYSSDRKTRVLACELLQAFVVVFLGRTKGMTESSRADLEDLFRNIALPLLQLACDIDKIVRDIFEPLFMQIIHWYTSRVQRESSHLAVIIDVLMDGVTHPTNAALRDFSGKCINEFVKWTIKQSSEDELPIRPTNIKVLIKMMRFYSGHPDLVKKLAAALIFNNIYKEIREERALISIFAIELLHIFVTSLELLDVCNEEVENTVIHISNAIHHLKRIFIEKSALFKTDDALRRVPSDIPQGNLIGVVRWLLTMTGSQSKYCRDISMDLYISIQPLSGSKTTLSSFTQENADGYLVSLYLQSLEKYPTLKEVETKDTPALLKWLQALLCQLDGLTFIVKHSLCSINFANNIIMRSVNYFLENLQDLTIEQGLKLMCQDAALPYYTPENKEQYQQLKAACCLAVLRLAASLMNNINIDTLVIWTKSFWALILNAIFKPVSVGFDETLGQSEHSLILRHLLDTLPRKLNSNLLGELISVLTDYVKVNFNVEIDLRRNVSLKQRSLLKGLLSIQGTQLDIHFKAKQFSKGLIDKLMNNFLTGADKNIVYIDRLSELTSEHCSLILEFALNDPDELNSLIEHLNRNLLVTCPDITENQMLFGVYLLTKFAEPLVKIILSDFDKLLNGCDSMELVFAITSHLLKYLDVHKEEFKGTFEGLSTAVLAKWTMFEAYFEDNNVDLGVAFIRHLWRLFSPYLPYTPDVQKWLLNLLCREEVLLTESEGIAFYLNVFEVLAEVADDNICDLRPALKTFQARLAANQSNSPATIDKLLNVLPNVKSQTVFKFLLELYLNDEPLDKSDADLSSLIKAFVARNPEGKQLHILRTVYQLGLDKGKTFEQKKLLADKVLPYIFKECSYAIFENFFEENIQHLTNGLENLSNYGDGLVYFSLLEILFLRIPIGSDERPNCSITEASGNPKLRTLLLKLSLDAFRDKTESENKNNLRVYKCFAYKSLASIVSNSIKTPSLYEKLFVRKEKDEDILWNALIDTTSTYSFAVDFDSYPKKRKVLINIRDHLREQSSENKNKSLRYIESQRLFNSSLSEDVTKFDFTNSVIRSHGQKQENVDEDGQATFVQGEVFLESTEVNNHELMGTVCGVIGHIFSTGICQLPEDPEELVEFPNWMKGIAQLLLNPNTHPNIKIFWVKVIDNMIHIFRYFAKYFVEPLLQFLNDKVAGNSLNYFVSDVIVILATWSNDVKPSEKEAKLASNFLKYVIKLLTNDRQDSFKYNLDLVKLLVENWKDFIEVPHEAVSEKLQHEITNRQIEVGIHLTSIFLVNGLLPCEVSNLSSFWKTLIKPLGSTVSTIYKPCAETVGLLLKYLKLHEMERDSFQSELKMFLLKLQDVSKYAGCLEGVAIHYPEIVDEDLIIRNLSRLPQADPNLQTVFLKLICKRTDILGEISYFKSEEWDRYLESQNAAVQLITLEIILKTIGILKNEKSFKGILKSASKNILNPNSFCRGRMYDIMMAILENDIDDDDVLELCKEVLLQGLTDSDVEIREKIRTFWCENPVVPSDISQKFPYLLSNFYLTKTEDHFLGYMSYFLLESIKSDEYEKELFEHPLEDCDFEEYKLQTNWRLQHPSVVPMFAETLRSYSEDFDMVSGNLGALRGTQDVLTFAPTQQTTAREMHISQFTSLESSLFASRGEVSDFNKFLNPNDVQLSQKYKLNKRRFLKDKTKVSKGFAHRAVAQKQHEIVQRYDAAKEREKKVTIYRSYRKGDFPDIQITLGSIVKPLQMLVLNDSELAKTFFSVIYNTLKEKVKSSDNNFTFTVLSSIKRIFDTSIQYNTNVFSTLLDILLKSKGEFRLDPEIIAGVCQQSGLVSVGTLLIEEYIMNLDDIPSASKRGNGAADAETTHWLKLAGLYRELHEWDLVKTIFIEKSNCKEDVHRAIQFEGEKRWREAQETYESLIRTDFSAERQDFYYESYFKCLAHLGEWEKLPKAVEDLVPEGGEKTWGSLWSNDWFQQKILPWYISAQVKNILFTGNENQQFYIDLNASLSREDQAQYLKSTFSEELCMLFLTRKENNQAMQYLKNGLENFLNEWQSLNPMFGTLRYDKVLNLRTLIEIERFLSTEKSLTEFTAEDNLRSLQAYWNSTRNEFLPSIILSESKLLYRRRFIKLLMEDLDRLGSTEYLKRDLRKSQILLDISFMNLAVEESNYYMVRKYFRSYAEMNHPSLTMIYGSMACLYSNLAKKNPQLQVEKLLEGLTKFKQVVDSPKKDKVIASLLKIVDISEKVTEITHNNPDLYHRCDSILSEIFGSNRGSPLEAACDCLKSHILQIPLDSNKEDTIKEHAKALVKLAYFAQDKPDQEKDFVVFVLRAMKLGSKEARQLFPCILLKDSLADEVERDFIRESNGIPTWMFLGWIPQLLANVDTPKVAAIADIILRIAKAYPQAIMYSYRLSKASYSETLDESLDDTIRLVGELDALLLSDPLVDRFLEALSKVSIPLVTLTYYIKKMSATKDVQTSLIIINELMDFFFKATSDSRESSSMQGNMYKQIKDFKGEFQKLKEQTSLKALQDSLKIVENKLKTLLEKAKMSKELKDYCPWLANLSGGKLNMELEIPGQYSGDKLPLVQHHVKISGFRREVSVMISLRKPIKVTILGMDSKEYPFLIKFGEDIRQDQRIQQLFMLMNNIFANDNKSHHLLTYQVIPLTSSLGIIQWVDQTVSLESFIKRSVPNRRGDVFDSLRSKYQSFLGKNLFDLDGYGSMALKKKRDKVIPFFQSLVNLIPRDVLRTSIWKLSLSTESFIAFRDNFIKSYAINCVCHWILGIGDRHLQNFLVCTRNGKILGIDFGHAFGTATQALRIPELVPIRLTPHIVGLMEPLKERGALRNVMIDCLKSLRANRGPLLATMNVFIQEPSVDWLEQAKKFESSEHTWYPLEKLNQAKRKFGGTSSSTILIEDLKSSLLNHSRPQYIEAYVSLVKGDPQFDLRARLSTKENLSVEEQVDSLIDHATDQNLLGRMFAGWNAAV